MNKTVDEAALLSKALKEKLSGESRVDILVCPPSIDIVPIQEILKDSNIEIGAQNMHYEAKGAFTGEISAEMILSSKASYVIIGHSERRHVFSEDDKLIGKKVKKALDSGLKTILCIGEKLEERESDKTIEVLSGQLEGGLSDLKNTNLDNLVIAYEPVWAIGTGKTASSQQAQDAHAFVRSWIKNKFGQELADKIRILYGGSVKPHNAYELLSCPDVDGALIGGASLKADSFSGIVNKSIKVLENNKS